LKSLFATSIKRMRGKRDNCAIARESPPELNGRVKSRAVDDSRGGSSVESTTMRKVGRAKWWTGKALDFEF